MAGLRGLGDLPGTAGRPGWRIEVTRRGKFWNWRAGSKDRRRGAYGGKFELLSDERKREYGRNKAKREKAKAAYRAG